MCVFVTVCYRNGTVCVCLFVLWEWYCVHLSFCVMEMEPGGAGGGGVRGVTSGSKRTLATW